MKKEILYLMLGTLLTTPAMAGELKVSNQQAVRIIVGEAENQPFLGKVAVGEVIRRRNSLKGFYGLRRSLKRVPEWVFDEAEEAWAVSQTSNVSKGADSFENVEEFGKPAWADKCKVTVKIADHTFYKCP